MNLFDFYNPRVQFTDNDGNPYSGGSISFYDSATTTLTAVYTDPLGATPALNPQILDAGGFLTQNNLYLPANVFKVVLRDSNGNTIWTRDPLTTYNANPAGIVNAIFYDNMASLIQIVPSDDGTLAYVPGYYNSGDEGGGWFYWSASSSDTPDMGSVFASVPTPATGRWIRIFDGNDVIPQQFGAIPERQTSTAESPLLSAQIYCVTTGKRLVLNAGEYYLSGDVDINSSCNIKIEDGFIIRTKSGSPTLTLDITNDGLVEINTTVNIRGDGSCFFIISGTGATKINPIWWKSPNLTEYEGWRLANANATGCIIILDRDWDLGIDSDDTCMAIEIGDIGSMNVAGGQSGFTLTIDRVYETIERHYSLPVFKGTLNLIRINTIQEVPVRWFNTTNTAFDSYNDIWISATNDGDHPATIVFDTGLSYTLTQDSATSPDVYHSTKFTNNSGIIFSTFGVNFGNIIAPEMQIFQGDSASSNSCYNPIIPVAWFGAVAGQDTTAVRSNNASAIKSALSFPLFGDASNPWLQQYITGNGGVYTVSASITIPERSKTVCLRDITIDSNVTTADAVNISSSVMMNNVNVYSTTTSAYNVIAVNALNTEFSTSGLNTIFEDCSIITSNAKLMNISNSRNISVKNTIFQGGSGLTFDYTIEGKIEFVGNTTSQGSTPYTLLFNSGDILFTGNYIQDNIVEFKNSGVADNSLNINGNTFKKTNVYIYGNITNTNVTGNNFSGSTPRVGQIQLWADSGRIVIDGLLIEGNSFSVDSPTTTRIVGLIGISSIADRVIVRNNTCKNIYPVKTHDISFTLTDADITPTTGAPGFDFTIPNSAGWLFSSTGKPLATSRVTASNTRTGDTTYKWSNYWDADFGYNGLKVCMEEDAGCPTLPAMRVLCPGGLTTTPYDTRFIKVTNLSVTEG